MYYLLLELPALRQLTATRSEWARGIEGSIDSVLRRYRVERLERSEDFRLYLLPPIGQGNVGELISFLHEMHQLLEEVKEDLLGYTLLLHRTDSSDGREILRQLKGMLLPVALEDGLWFTEEAMRQLRGAVEHVPGEEGELYHVQSLRESLDLESQPIGELVASRKETKALASRLRGHGPRRRLVFVRDLSGGGARWALRSALKRAQVNWIEAEPDSLESGRLWLGSAPAIGRSRIGEELNEEIRRFETECSNFVFADIHRSFWDSPQGRKRNLWHEAISLCLGGSAAFMVCFDAERWGAEEVTTLGQLLEEADPAGKLTVLAAGTEYASLFGTLSDEPEEIAWGGEECFFYEEFLIQRAGKEAPTAMEAILSTYEERELLLLYLHRYYGTQLSGQRVEKLAGRLGLSPVEYRAVQERFLADGLLWSRPDGTHLLLGEPEAALTAGIDVSAKNRLTRIVGAELLHLRDQGDLEERPELFATMLFAAGQGEQERLLRDYLWDRLPLFDDEAVGQWLFGFDALKRERLRRLAEIFRWRAKLGYPGDPGELPSREAGSGGLLEAEYNLGLAEAYYMEGLMHKSLHRSKRALAQFMQLNDTHGRTRAYMQLGLVSMAKGDLGDASAYLGYAVDSARGAKRAELRLKAQALREVVAFVYGNFSRVVQEAPDLSAEARQLGLSRWELFCHFLYGRALLEFGRLDEAERAFAAVYRLAETVNEPGAARVAQRWGWRSYRLYPEGLSRECYLPPGQERESLEGELFELERRFFSREPAPPETESAGRGESAFHPIYRLSWESGFTAVEDLVETDTPRTANLLLFALNAWFKAQRGELGIAREELHWLTRVERVSQYDLYRPTYLYLYSDVLPLEGEAETEDRQTVLGKSVKLLQERTSRLDRSGDKERYLHSNRWNRLLIREAKLLNML
ncbi:MAG: hypothetical protein ACLFPP_11375 [Spirochaetaceae bacterium]